MRKNLVNVLADTAVLVPKRYLLASAEHRPDTFFELYDEYYRTYHENYKLAWMILEDDLADLGLPHRYSSYESFLVGRQNYLKKKRKQAGKKLK